jgi:ATP synthase protein I
MGRLKNLAKNSPTAARLSGLGTVGEVSSVGLSFQFALFIGTAGGWRIDQRLGSKPWGFLIGLVLGLAAGIRNVYVVLSKYAKGGSKPTP